MISTDIQTLISEGYFLDSRKYFLSWSPEIPGTPLHLVSSTSLESLRVLESLLPPESLPFISLVESYRKTHIPASFFLEERIFSTPLPPAPSVPAGTLRGALQGVHNGN